MNNPLVTRDALHRWGFLRLPDAWLYSPCLDRNEYFEAWYHPEWNCRVYLGFPEADPLLLHEQAFLRQISELSLGEEDGPEPCPDLLALRTDFALVSNQGAVPASP